MAKSENIEGIVFDLDGTLTKSDLTIFKTMEAVFEKMEIEQRIPYEKFCTMIGFHFQDIFREHKIDIPDIEHFITTYKSHYFEYINDTTVYPGVYEILEYLKEHKYKTAILTTKAQDQVEQICEHFGLTKYFDIIKGRIVGEQIKPSPEPLCKIAFDLNLDTKNLLMVGDTIIDVECGKSAGSLTAAALYGYGNNDEIKNMNPDFILNDINKLYEILQ